MHAVVYTIGLFVVMHEQHYVSPTNLIYLNPVFKSFKSLNIEN